MRFNTPRNDLAFEIPDDWWDFADMREFTPSTDFYVPTRADDCQFIPLAEIEPFQRSVGTNGFRKYKIVPVLFALQSPEPTLPPINLGMIENAEQYRYRLQNGFHRFYASVAVGYSHIAAFIE